jgi:HK97 gp10 family phage protein
MSQVAIGIGTRPTGAADHVRFEVRGAKELKRKLDELADKEVKKIVRQAMRAGAKVILPKAKAYAPVGATGNLRRAIKVRAAKRSRKYIGVNVTLGEGFFIGDAFYGAFQEFGWKTGKRKSAKRRQVGGKHFMQRAAEQSGKAAGDAVISTIWNKLRARALMRGGLGGGVV